MPGWNKIVCAIDFTTASQRALAEAAALARSLGADLALVHVYEREDGRGGSAARPMAALEAAAAELHRKIEGWKLEAQRLSHRTVHAAVLGGEVVPEVARFARTTGADAVVIAAPDLPGRPAVLGALADRVLREAHCPVVVVPAPARGAREEPARRAAAG